MILTLFNYINKPLTMLAILISFVSALFICMPFHEFAHAHAALKEGDYTSKALKRYTMAPFAHIDTAGLVMLLFFGIGFAKPVPIDSRNFKRGRLSAVRVSLAGVLVNILIGVISCFLYVLIFNVWPQFFSSYGFISELYYYFFNFMISLNFMFAFFNLLPIYPLDGFRLVEACSKTENGFLRFMRMYGFWIMLLLLFTNVLDVYIEVCAGGLSSLIVQGFDKFIKLF